MKNIFIQVKVYTSVLPVNLAIIYYSSSGPSWGKSFGSEEMMHLPFGFGHLELIQQKNCGVT